MTNGKRSYGIKVKTKDDEFTIPVIDARDGEHEQTLIKNMIRNTNRQTGSKYMRPSFGQGGGCYQISQKK